MMRIRICGGDREGQAKELASMEVKRDCERKIE